MVWVRATDPSGEGNDENRDAIQVTITATDVNDAPKVVDGWAEISIDEVNGAAFVELGYMQDGTMDPANPNLYHRSDEDRVDRGIWPEPIAGLDGDFSSIKSRRTA